MERGEEKKEEIGCRVKRLGCSQFVIARSGATWQSQVGFREGYLNGNSRKEGPYLIIFKINFKGCLPEIASLCSQ